MNEKLEKLVDLFIKSIEKGGDFAVEQLPDLAQQIIHWGVGCHLIWVLSWLSLFACFSRKKAKLDSLALEKKWDFWADVEYGIPGCLLILAMVLSSIGALAMVLPAMKALIAPKLYLLDYLRAMSK